MLQNLCGHKSLWAIQNVVLLVQALLLLLAPCVVVQATDMNFHQANNGSKYDSRYRKEAQTMVTTTIPLGNTDRGGVQVKCGSTQKMVDNCFRDLPPHLMEFLQTSKIAINEQEITSKCNVFRRGMKCFDDYTERCIPQHNINILNNNVEGARRFFTKFCEDTTFQNHYLTHKECFTYIQDDWFHCNKQFQNILSEGIHSGTNVTHKFMEFCCARYAYETCIFNSARYKCYTNSASFARETAKMLSDEKHFSKCRQYEESMCNRSTHGTALCPWSFRLVMLLWLWMSKATMLPCQWKWKWQAAKITTTLKIASD
ncbi:uncharacterized protein LOC106082583 [Stomoxys calcitrans]|uniref:uncharacterized protein LOC106082583 n=1 Tax=Stomoxys calcitrans TaxID=35570 RepID=UPI0027E2FFD7|nr:uncharacterized protein LOC106082583 [Stomoxys calcitrans]